MSSNANAAVPSPSELALALREATRDHPAVIAFQDMTGCPIVPLAFEFVTHLDEEEVERMATCWEEDGPGRICWLFVLWIEAHLSDDLIEDIIPGE